MKRSDDSRREIARAQRWTRWIAAAIAFVVLALASGCSGTSTHSSGSGSSTGIGSSTGTGSSGGTGSSASSGSSGGSTGFLPPDVLDDASFEDGWDGFTDWSGSPTPSGATLSRATDYAHTGSHSARRTWTPNPNADTGSQFLFHIGNADRVWIRFYFRATANISTIMKFARFYDANFSTPLGGFFMGSGNQIFSFGTDAENSSITTWFGLDESQVLDGNWHSLELDYWRNGDPSGFPSAAFWFDGSALSEPDGTNVHYAGAGNSSYWRGGRLYSGERSDTSQIGYIEWLATLNAGNTTTGQVNLDDVSISTRGRIGP